MRDFDVLWDYQHPAQTEQRFRSRLLECSSTESSGYKAELLTQLARALGLQEKFDEAHLILNQAEALLSSDEPAAQVRYLLERGRVFNSSRQPSEALPFFLEAWELGRRAKEDNYAVDAAHMLGIAETTPDTQMAWNLKALELAESSLEARSWLGSLYNNIGWAQVDAGNLNEALDLFSRSLLFREEQNNTPGIAIARWSMAKVLRLLGRTEEAIAIQRELLEDAESDADPSGYVYEEMAECLLDLGKPEEAREFFSRASELLSLDRWLIQNEPDRLERLKAKGQLEPI